MKVLHLISGGDTGGAKTHIISLLKGLNKSIDAKVICFIKDTFYEEALQAGINIDVYEQESRKDMSIVNKLADEINNEGYDIIHCHGARANFIAMFLKRKVNKPMITTIHSDYALDFKDNFYKRIIYTSLNSMALRRFDYYIAISDSFKEMLIDRGFKANKIYVSYNGIDMDIKNKYSKEEFLKEYNVENKYNLIVGIVARLHKVKNHETFIMAASKVLDKRNDILFLIAGTGNEETRLKELVKNLDLEDNIKFLGYMKDPYSFYNAIDINTLTSLSESFPYVILEGAVMKKTMVSTNVGGISRLIKDDYNGYLFDVKDVDNLSSKILELADNSNKLQTLGENLYEDVKMNYSSESMANRHIEIYKEVSKDI